MNFGLVSTRFSGTDGVSLEALKWAEVLERSGHRCFWLSGLSDRPEDCSSTIPEAHFEHPEIQQINDAVWIQSLISKDTHSRIDRVTDHLRAGLRDFIDRFAIDCLIPQNASTIPMNLPLGLALAREIQATSIPTIAHHHDFYWERDRFAADAARPILEEAFPPFLPTIHHVVINSQAQRDLRSRLDLESTLIPNVMDFDALRPDPRQATTWREKLGFKASDRIFLQPTRIVPRKGIEHAIDLVAALDHPADHLLISHEAGDEGYDYQESLRERAQAAGVSLHLLGNSGDDEGLAQESPSLAAFYQMADFVTYPSLYEGFGNALLEAVYFRKPALVNRYPVYVDDIEPAGFQFVTMDGAITPRIVDEVSSLLENQERQQLFAEKNYEIGKRQFSFDSLQASLEGIIASLKQQTRK